MKRRFIIIVAVFVVILGFMKPFEISAMTVDDHNCDLYIPYCDGDGVDYYITAPSTGRYGMCVTKIDDGRYNFLIYAENTMKNIMQVHGSPSTANTYYECQVSTARRSSSYNNTAFIVFKTDKALLDYVSKGILNKDDVASLPDGKIIDGNTVKETNEIASQGNYNNNIPNMKGTKIVPVEKGKPSTDYKLTWTSQKTNYHVDIMITYSYKTGAFSSVKYKDLLIKNYMNDIKDIDGTYILSHHEMVEFAKKDNSEDSKVFSGYGFTKVYIRYSDYSNSKYTFGNWRYITIYNGQQGVIESGSGDTTIDDNGNIIELPMDDHTDEDGNSVSDGTSFSNFSTNIGSALSSFFGSCMSLFNSIGSFNTLIGGIFGGMPGQITSLLVVGVGFLVIGGIIKFFK